MALTKLSTGCLMAIMEGNDVDKPIVQILGHKRIASTEGSERYRLLLSDGQYLHSFAMLGTQLNDLVVEGKLTENTIVRIEKYITSIVNKQDKNERKVLILLGIEVLHIGATVGMKIGNPIDFSKPKPQQKNENQSVNSSAAVAGTTSTNVIERPTNNNMNTSLMANQTLSDHLTHPIASLSPYQNKWVIKARVTSKTAVRTWNNAKGEGKLFSMDLMDESGEIRCTAFKDMCDKYFDVIQADKVYYISKCQLKTANKQFTSIKNDYEMTMTSDTQVEECKDANNMPSIKYNLVPIVQIANMEPNTIIDVLGVCRDTGDMNQFVAKASGRELKKREIVLIDKSNASINFVLWGIDAENFDGFTQPVVLIKNARVTEFGGGKSISIGSGGSFKINPNMPEGHQLRGWFDNGGSDAVVQSISAKTGAGATNINTEWMSFQEIKSKNLPSGDQPHYFQCKAVIHLIKNTNALYKACPAAECNKKVVDNENGTYRCEKCNAQTQNFKWRLLLNMSIGDWTSNRWVTCFSDTGEKLFGKTSTEIGEAFENDKELADSIFGSLSFKSFIFKLRSKVETYADSPRVKTTIMSATPINYKEYNNYLIKNIQSLTGIGKSE